MANQFLEYFLINILNGAKQRRAMKAQQQDAPPVTQSCPPPDYTILGHLIPDAEPPLHDPVLKQLSDAGVVALSPQDRLRHLYLLGATGTGKTNLLLRLIESDIRNKRAFCVIDLRGDLVDRVLLRLAAAAPPSAWKDRLLLVDLRDGEHVVGFNPLSGQGKGNQEDAYNRALHMLSVLKLQSGSWGVQLEDTLRYALMALSETGWSLLEVRPLLTNAGFRQQVMEQVQDTHIREFFAEFDLLSQTERSSRASAALNKLSPLMAVPALRLMFGQRQGFSFRELLDRNPGMIILISLAVDRLHDAARLAGGLLVSSVQTAAMAQVNIPESQRVPTHLYIDEFECMASDRFEAIVAEGRRFGLGLTLSHQNLSQLPLNLRQVIRNNVHTQVYFQTGAVDAGDLAKEIGQGQGSAAVRAALMSQDVGEAFLVRRTQPSSRMRTLRSDDPPADGRQLQDLRQASFSNYARRRAEVERELRERETEFQSLRTLQASQASGAVGKTVQQASYQIRHSKTAHFGPGTASPQVDQSSVKRDSRSPSIEATAETSGASDSLPPLEATGAAENSANSARTILRPDDVHRKVKRAKPDSTVKSGSKTKVSGATTHKRRSSKAKEDGESRDGSISETENAPDSAQ